MPYHGHSSSAHLQSRLLLALGVAAGLLLVILILQILLPWLMLGALIGLAFWLWNRHQAYHKALHTLFYQLIQKTGGRISALDFAMATNLTGSQARAFLDARAREFCANFEATPQGDVLYTFSIRSMATPETAGAPATTSALVVTSATEDAPLPKPPSALTPEELAARLGCSLTLMDQNKWSADFPNWVRERDPENITWIYDPLSGYCYPMGKG